MPTYIAVYRDEHSGWADEYVCEHAAHDEKAFDEAEQYADDVVLCASCASLVRGGAEIIKREPEPEEPEGALLN